MGFDRTARRILQYTQEVWHMFAAFWAGLVRRPVDAREYLNQMYDAGVSSLPVVGITGIVTGMVLALQSYISLEQFGGTSVLPNAITGTLVRELGPILGSLMVAGRVGAGITSQIGAMKVTSQIDAMLALGTDPVKKLVVPRVVALVITLPMLVAIVCFLGIAGGWALARVELNFPTPFYWSGVVENLRFVDIASSMVKSAVFGFVIALFSCVEGFRTQGGTAGVGVATTKAVVVSSLAVVVSDFFLTKIFYTLLP
jgi:phospholipid/cholesterol/gamma-HCH transport system permease protein